MRKNFPTKCQKGSVAFEYVIVTLFSAAAALAAMEFLRSRLTERMATLESEEAPFIDF